VLDLVLERRCARRLTTVVDTLGLDGARRRGYLELARRHSMPCHAVAFDTPAVANGLVYVGVDATLEVFKAKGCRKSKCSPVWSGDASGSQAAIVSSPAVANGVVYVAGFDSKVYAANASGCGVATCSPLWTFKLDVPLGLAPVVIDGRVMVTGSVIQAFELP